LSDTTRTPFAGDSRGLIHRAALWACVAVFAVLWAGGVASYWLGREDPNQGLLASLFLLVGGLVVLLGVRGAGAAAALLAVALVGFVVEAVGVRTGIPFGRYAYTGVLQPQMFGVPVVMGPAWMTLVAFACDVTRRLRLKGWRAVLAAAILTTATDLVIDPLAAHKFGYWTWERGGAYYGIPLTNFVGWFVTALITCALAAPRQPRNLWAGFVGTAVLLFFALVALSDGSLLVALIGFALCGFRLLSPVWAGAAGAGTARGLPAPEAGRGE